jgi:hypothetical protein
MEFSIFFLLFFVNIYIPTLGSPSLYELILINFFGPTVIVRVHHFQMMANAGWRKPTFFSKVNLKELCTVKVKNRKYQKLHNTDLGFEGEVDIGDIN